MKKEEDQGFKILGFATGWYNNYCSDCGKEFIGDKRAFQCLSCAIKSVGSMQLENAKLKGQLSETEEKLKRAYKIIVEQNLEWDLRGTCYCKNCECIRIRDLHEDDCFVKEAQTWLEDKE